MNKTQTSSGSPSSVGRILMIVIPVAIVLVGLLLYFRFANDIGLGSKRTPKLAEVNGVILFRNQPLEGATVQSVFVDDPTLVGGMAKTDSEGKFTFETLVGSELKPGLFQGKHKIVVFKALPGVGAAAGPMMTPPVYSQPGSTPVELTVTSAGNDKYELTLEVDEDTMSEEDVTTYLEELPARQASTGAARGNRGGGPAGGAAGGFDPDAFFAEQDADDDGKLTGDEIPERMRERLEEIDADKDGAISKDEFDAARPQGGRGGGTETTDNRGGNE